MWNIKLISEHINKTDGDPTFYLETSSAFQQGVQELFTFFRFPWLYKSVVEMIFVFGILIYSCNKGLENSANFFEFEIPQLFVLKLVDLLLLITVYKAMITAGHVLMHPHRVEYLGYFSSFSPMAMLKQFKIDGIAYIRAMGGQNNLQASKNVSDPDMKVEFVRKVEPIRTKARKRIQLK